MIAQTIREGDFVKLNGSWFEVASIDMAEGVVWAELRGSKSRLLPYADIKINGEAILTKADIAEIQSLDKGAFGNGR
ncbi:MAG: hypothetical protein J6T16_05950 [Opitutales bacterium]|nr:hypothetical protein [Opitutales bacterium]